MITEATIGIHRARLHVPRGWVAQGRTELDFDQALVDFIWRTYGRHVSVAIGWKGEPYDTCSDVEIEVGGTVDPTVEPMARALYDAALNTIASYVEFLSGVPAEVKETQAHSGGRKRAGATPEQADEPLTTDKVQ